MKHFNGITGVLLIVLLDKEKTILVRMKVYLVDAMPAVFIVSILTVHHVLPIGQGRYPWLI